MSRRSDSTEPRRPPPGRSAALAGIAAAALFLGAVHGAAGQTAAAPDAAAPDRSAAAVEMAKEEAAAPDEIVVRILPAPEVAGDTFTLGDVAEFDGFDVGGAAALAKISLGRSPAPGRSLTLSEPFVRSRLAGLPQAEKVRLVVPHNAQVSRKAQAIPAAEIESLVLARALKDAGGDPAQVKQELITPLADLLFPRGEVEWRVEPMGKHLVPGGDRTYQVIAQVDAKEVWRMPVRVRQKVYRTVVVAKRPIRRDQTISGDDLATVRRTVTTSDDAGYAGNPAAVVGKKAKRPIAQDEPISEGIVRVPAAVSEGGRVRVVFETPALLMEVPGVAMAAGQIGQFIPVRNLDSGKVVYGVVESDERVKVN